jgi:hypothetical protein
MKTLPVPSSPSPIWYWGHRHKSVDYGWPIEGDLTPDHANMHVRVGRARLEHEEDSCQNGMTLRSVELKRVVKRR